MDPLGSDPFGPSAAAVENLFALSYNLMLARDLATRLYPPTVGPPLGYPWAAFGKAVQTGRDRMEFFS